MLDLLCRLTRAKRTILAASSSADNSFDELMNVSTSSLEKEWLRYLRANAYHLPDRGQLYLKEFNTRPDFAYINHQTLIYIDGPHHAGQAQKTLDGAITQRLEDAGFTVVRFATDKASWNGIADKYAWVFGPGIAPTAD